MLITPHNFKLQALLLLSFILEPPATTMPLTQTSTGSYATLDL